MAFVLDSSVVLAWLLPDEKNAAADRIADRFESEPAVVPAIWRLEVGNALLMARRRERLTDKEVERLLAALVDLPIEQEPGHDDARLSRVIALARSLGLTSYDAAYLEIAQRRDIPVATFDARLREACLSAKVALLP